MKSAALEVGEKVKQPSDYDYYDKDFKIGIMIEGDSQFKQNVTDLIETFKQVTPDDYADLIKYAPKKIVRSPDTFSWYGSSPDNPENDVIQLPESIEMLGGSDDLNKRRVALPNIYTELRSAMQSKTGVKFSGFYDAVMDDETDKYNYGVKIGLWTQEQADLYLKSISEQLKSGTYIDGAKLPKETVEKFKKEMKELNQT